MIEFVPMAIPKNIKCHTMKMKAHPKSNKLPTWGNSGDPCSSMTHSDFHPASKALICLGWLRLYQTILLNRSTTRHALPH
jgi:hypothetical protein